MANKYQGVLDRYRSDGGGQSIPAAKIRAWVELNFPDFKPRKDGTEYRINNPFTADAGYHMQINMDGRGCNDWTGNEWAGPINPVTNKRNCSFLKFVKLYRKCSYAEAVREVMGSADNIASFLRPENRQRESDVKQVSVTLPGGTERLADNINDPQAAMVISWLKRRGYSLEDIDKNDIHFLGVDCYWVYYEFDTLVYWQSRNRFNKVFKFPPKTIHDGKGRVAGETEGSKGDFLYGFDDCECASYLNITESIFCKHTLGPQSLASGGAQLTNRQLGKIQILGPRDGIVLSPDNDKAGIKSILTNSQLLNGYKLLYSIPPRLPYVKDGKTKYIKDWNEMVEELKMSNDEVREVHQREFKPINMKNLTKLRQQAAS